MGGSERKKRSKGAMEIGDSGPHSTCVCREHAELVDKRVRQRQRQTERAK